MTDELVERVTSFMRQAGFDYAKSAHVARAIVPIVQAAERERCAKVAEALVNYATAMESYDDGRNDAATEIAAVIREGDEG